MFSYAWVIENNTKHGILYWNGFDWYFDHMKAIRYSRRIDAQKTMYLLEPWAHSPNNTVAEHGWDDALEIIVDKKDLNLMEEKKPETVMKPGWECKRCGSVNAPDLSKCQCKPIQKEDVGSDTKELLQEVSGLERMIRNIQ